MATVLITGANGFVGKVVGEKMIADGWRVRGAVRSQEAAGQLPEGVEAVIIDAIGADTDWPPLLKGIDVVIHLAARVHVMDDKVADPLSEFRRVNTIGTQRLAQAAAAAGVRRLVYLSSIKVNGERTDGRRFTEQDPPDPQDAYAISKWEAEQVLHTIEKETGLEIVILRPPLVYGPGVKGNFLRLLGWVDLGIPLPFGSVDNRRSLIGVDNLVDLIVRCVRHPRAAGQCFLAADDLGLSTADLVRQLAAELGRAPRLFSFPPRLLHGAATVIGKEEVFQRLCRSLEIDSSKSRSLLQWSPPLSVAQGLSVTAKWYKTWKKKKYERDLSSV